MQAPTPIDFRANVQDPFQAALQGFQAGGAIRQQREQRALLQVQREEVQRRQADLANLANNPTSENFTQTLIRNPDISEDIKRAWDAKNADQQKNSLSQMSQVHASLLTGNTKETERLLNVQKESLINAGRDQEVGAIDALLKQVGADPKAALTSTGLAISAIVGPDKYAQTFETLTEQKEEDKLTLKEQFGVAKDFSEDFTQESINVAIKSKDPTKLKPKALEDASIFTKEQLKVVDPWVERIQGRPEFKDARDGIVSAIAVETLLGQDIVNPVADSAAIAKLARVITGPGVLTESDKQSVVGDKSIFTEIMRVAKRAKDGIILDKDRALMRKATDIMKQRAAQNLNGFLETQVESFDARHGIGVDKLKRVTDPFRVSEEVSTTEVQPPAQPVDDATIQRLIDKYL